MGKKIWISFGKKMGVYVFGKVLTKVVFFGMVDGRLKSVRVEDEETAEIQKNDYNAYIEREH